MVLRNKLFRSKEKPIYWFRSIHDDEELPDGEPEKIEYLKISTGETFIHKGGTTYWLQSEDCFDITALIYAGITHWRLIQ